MPHGDKYNQDTDFFWFLAFSDMQLHFSLAARFTPAAKSHREENLALNNLPFILSGCAQYSEVDMFTSFEQFNTETQTFQGGLTPKEWGGHKHGQCVQRVQGPVCVSLVVTIITFLETDFLRQTSRASDQRKTLPQLHCVSSQLASKGESRQCPGSCWTHQQPTKTFKTFFSKRKKNPPLFLCSSFSLLIF